MKTIKLIKKTIIVSLTVIAIVGLSYFGYSKLNNQKNDNNSDFGYSIAEVVDVIGTAIAPYDFSATGETTATTSGTIFVGDDVNILNFDIQFVKASTSNPYATLLYVEKSNSADCATTTADGVAGVYWVDATPLTSTAKTSTSTFAFTPDQDREGTTIQITNWNGLCARLTIGSASTTAWVSASKQELNR